MLPLSSATATPPERRLAALYAALGDADRHALLAFAEFLATAGARRSAPADQDAAPPTPPPDPPATPADPDLPIPAPRPRPPEERVIAAIRRLGDGYPMLDRGAMLHQTAALMSQHVVQGRAAAATIDDLEALFERHYQEYRRQESRRRHPATGADPDDAPPEGPRPTPHG